MKPHRWLLEAPLGLLSIALNRVLHARVSAAATRQARAVAAPAWSLLDGALLADDRALLAFSLRAPRWNPHAVIAFSPVLRVQERLSVHAAAAWAATERWTLVVYDERGACATLGSAFTGREAAWAEAVLPAGEYRLALRLYDPAPGAEVPEVRVDGQRALAPRPVPEGTNAVYATLRQRAKGLHRLLQAYAFPMVMLRRWLGEARVGRLYLPVGNPETTFQYGVVERGEQLELTLHGPLPPGCGVYLCLYDRASFPMLYTRVEEPRLVTPPADDDGTWLLRVVPGAGGAPGPEAITVRCVGGGP